MTDSQALLQEGLAAFRARAYDEALRAWRTLLSFEPDHPQVKELVARTETLAAEGQIVHQLKEELADLREELATTRDSRNDLLLEMARVHKRYEEREARLWRMQEAREWELREALADAELQSFQFGSSEPSNLSDQDLLSAAEDALLETPHESTLPMSPDQVAKHPPVADHSASDALQKANEQLRVLRNELHLAHERIVELEQQVQQYEHDENEGEYGGPLAQHSHVRPHALHDPLAMSDEEHAAAFDHVVAEDDDQEDAFGFLAPAAFQAVESQTIETDQNINEDALFGVNPKDTQASNIIGDFSDFNATTDDDDGSDDEDDAFTGPLIADEVLNQPTSPHDAPKLDRVSEGSTLSLERNVVGRNDPATGSFVAATSDDDLEGVPSEDEPVIDTLFDLVKEETSGMIHLESASKQEPKPSFEAVDAPEPTPTEPKSEVSAHSAEDRSNVDEIESTGPTTTDESEDDDETLTSLAPSGEGASGEVAEPTAQSEAAGTKPVIEPSISALPPARPRDDSSDTAEIDLHPVDDKNLADGFSDELADALGSTPEPPRLMTGVQPELPDIDFMDDEPEVMSPEELERRPTWIPVRHKAKPQLDDAVASYLLTHIDGVSTFMELRGTVGLPPAAVDSGFRTLLSQDIIRVKRR